MLEGTDGKVVVVSSLTVVQSEAVGQRAEVGGIHIV